MLTLWHSAKKRANVAAVRYNTLTTTNQSLTSNTIAAMNQEIHNLSSREIDVLNIIVEDYIVTAAPVGSRTVAKKSSLKLSPASMRNTMADLTEKGYLDQPHTSAGRAPTPKAFRFYLDNALQLQPLTPDEQETINAHLTAAGYELSKMLSQASRLLSSVSRQVSMIIAPGHDEVRWRSLDFSLVKPGLVLVVLVLEGGIVENKLVPADTDLTRDDLITFSNYLNDHYRGKTLSEARRLVMQEYRSMQQNLKKLYGRALLLARLAFEDLSEREVYVDGASYMFDHVEFSDMTRLQEVLRLLEERSQLLDLLENAIAEQGVSITFGHEADLRDLAECSVISTRYGGDGRKHGVIGVIGPVRMNYAKVVPVVDTIANALTSLLKNRF